MAVLANYDVYFGEDLRWGSATVRYQLGIISYLEVRARETGKPAQRVAIYRSKDGHDIKELERTRGKLTFQIVSADSEPVTLTAIRNAKAGGCGCGGNRKASAA